MQTDTPGQKTFAYLDWHPMPRLDVMPDVDIESKRWLQNAVNNLVYYRGASFTLVGLKYRVHPVDHVKVELGVTISRTATT